MPRVLYISYYFPPSGGPGVQRTLKLARYLPEFGWTPSILTVRPEQAAYPDLDPSLEAEVPPELLVERTLAWDPYALYAKLQGKQKAETVGVGFVGESSMDWKQRLARWLRANLFLPDARVGWVRHAVAHGRRMLNTGRYDALITTGPPHSTHLIGQRLAREYDLPWVADFRDPWTQIDYVAELPMTQLARALDRRMERRVLEQASAVVTVSPAMRRQFEAQVPGAYHVILNGFDPADFDVASRPPQPEGTFVLRYLGNMNAARNPDVLWQALARLNAPTAWPDFRVELIGHIDPAVRAAVAAAGLESLVQVRPYVQHDAAVMLMQSATALLLVINRVSGAEGIMTGKLFEYLASGRPVVGVGPPTGDAAQALHDTLAGRMIGYEHVDDCARELTRLYKAWKQGAPAPGANPATLHPYSRRGQAEQLAGVLGALHQKKCNAKSAKEQL
ncbi:MAG: glycosyltransferase [Bacteroidota bacterium]